MNQLGYSLRQGGRQILDPGWVAWLRKWEDASRLGVVAWLDAMFWKGGGMSLFLRCLASASFRELSTYIKLVP